MRARCGTPAGYDRHLRRGEPTCENCRAAQARRLADWRADHPNSRNREKRLAAARAAATGRLRDMFPTEWLLLLADERKRAGL